MKKFLLILLLLIVFIAGLGVAVMLGPWKGFLEDKIKEAAEAQGLKGITLSIDSLTPTQLWLKDVKLPPPSTLKLDKVALDFTLQDILDKRVHGITLEGLNIEVQQINHGWVVAGLEGSRAGNSGDAEKVFALPFTKAALALFPLDTVHINNSTLQLNLADGALNIPFNGTFSAANGTLELHAPSLSLNQKKMSVGSGAFDVKIALNEDKQEWRGTYTLNNVVVKGIDYPLPSFSGGGDISADAKAINANGQYANSDKTYAASFTYMQPVKEGDAKLVLTRAAMPFSGGTIVTQNVNIPLGVKAPINAVLTVQNIPIDQFLQDLTGKKATGTGVVSGKLPISVLPDGKFKIAAGQLQAEQPGVISLQPDALPGDQEQMVLVREILKNLHYKLLSISFSAAPDNKMAINLALEGQNPDIESGRPVKLNVHLNGDLLDLMKNSISTITDPKSLLKKERNAK